MSFSALRSAGVEFPASIVSELELSGIAIERCRITGGREPAVRLVPRADAPPEPLDAASSRPGPIPAARARAQPATAPKPRREAVAAKAPPAAEPPPTSDEWTSVRRYRASSREGLLLALPGWRRVLAPVALVAAIATAVLIIVAGTGHGAARKPAADHLAQRPHPARAKATAKAPRTGASTHPTIASTSTTSTTPATPVSLTLAQQLESQGHGLLESGQYTQAVPILRRALAATGEDVSACVDPQSTMCLTYAYALYDLGRALRLSGDAAAAVPVLESRLQIDNQRPTVMAELELARQGAT